MTQECASLDTTRSAMIRWRSFLGGGKPTGSWPRRPSTLPRNAQALADIPAVGNWFLVCQAVQHVSTSVQRISFGRLTLVEDTYRQIHSSLSHCDLCGKVSVWQSNDLTTWNSHPCA